MHLTHVKTAAGRRLRSKITKLLNRFIGQYFPPKEWTGELQRSTGQLLRYVFAKRFEQVCATHEIVKIIRKNLCLLSSLAPVQRLIGRRVLNDAVSLTFIIEGSERNLRMLLRYITDSIMMSNMLSDCVDVWVWVWVWVCGCGCVSARGRVFNYNT